MGIRFASYDIEEINQIQSLYLVVHGLAFIPFKECVKKITQKRIIVLDNNKHIEGLLVSTYLPDKIFYRIDVLIVRSQFRKQGYGKALFDFFLKESSPKPIRIEILSTAVNKDNGEGFWYRLGFKPAGDYQITKRGNKLLPMLYYC